MEEERGAARGQEQRHSYVCDDLGEVIFNSFGSYRNTCATVCSSVELISY